jgi:transitional endoplasmic reticulum ATPase
MHFDGNVFDIVSCKPECKEYFTIGSGTLVILENQAEYHFGDVAVKDLASYRDFLPKLIEIVEMPWHFENNRDLIQIDCPKSVLLHGPSGTGKTAAVKIVSDILKAPLINLDGNEVASKSSGEIGDVENLIKSTFLQIPAEGRCILLLDDLHAMCPKRDNLNGGKSQQAQASRIVALILTFLDGAKYQKNKDLFVIGTSSRINEIDSAVRRAGRFDKELEVPVPSAEVRGLILEALSKQKGYNTSFDYLVVGRKLVGYVGSDIEEILKEAHFRAPNGLITNDILEQVIDEYIPSSRKGYNIEFSKTSWDDIGGLDHVKSNLKLIVEKQDRFKKIGLNSPKGILLYGAPGCSKTSLVRCLASSLSDSAAFFSTDGASIYSSYFGEAEANIRSIFNRARANSPCVLFLDEIDAIVSNRESDGSSEVQNRVLSTLLNELDGIQSTNENHVLVVAATNFPEKLDSALLRPGRFDHLIHVNNLARVFFLKIFTFSDSSSRLCISFENSRDLLPQNAFI